MIRPARVERPTVSDMLPGWYASNHAIYVIDRLRPRIGSQL